jgi:pyrimidine oxygenase
MKVGVFMPVGSRGWLMSTTSPETTPSFELNKKFVQKAESFGLDFSLSMAKFRGFAGPSQFWVNSLESFTITAAVAAVTHRIKLFASAAVLAMPPAVVARMASTIDSIAPGRFGINIVTGWQPKEYQQMGLWPGEQHFSQRYEYASEYVSIMRELWTTGSSSYQGEFFNMDDCEVFPMPTSYIEILGAGQSDRGIRFVAEHADYSFVACQGINKPEAAISVVERVGLAAAKTGRNVHALLLLMIITDKTDDAAFKKWEHYKRGTDLEALEWQVVQAGQDKKAPPGSTGFNLAQALIDPMPTGMLKLIGSHGSVAKMLDQISQIPGLSGVILTFDDFLLGIEQFGWEIQPKMECRRLISL